MTTNIFTNRKLDPRFQLVIKQADESIDDDDVMQDDDELFLPVEANKLYNGYVIIAMQNAGSIADLDYTLIVPAGAVGGFDPISEGGVQTPYGTEKFLSGSNNVRIITLSFWLEMGATAGNLQLQWAQSVKTVGSIVTIKNASKILMYE